MLPSSTVGLYGIPPSDAVVQSLATRARELLVDAAQPFATADVPHATHLQSGLPSRAIASAVARFGSDLVVLGTRGHSGLKHVLLGSVAERTLQNAPCPVVTTKAGDRL